MTNKPSPVYRTMTAKERDALSDKIQKETEYRDAARRDDGRPGMMTPTNDLGNGREVNTASIDNRIAKMKRELVEGTPEELDNSERLTAEREMKELKEKLGERLLTHKEMDLMPKDGYEYHRAVRKSTAQEVGNPETQRMMARYRELACRVDPDNQEAQSTEGLRKRQ